MSDEKLDRPRRSTRTPIKVPAATIAQSKRKLSNGEHVEQEHADAALSTRKKPKLNQLQILLQDTKSALTTMDISSVLNSIAWDVLSCESKARLATLLPATAFHGYCPSVEPTHPSQWNKLLSQDEGIHDTNGFRCADTVDTSIFTDSHFLAAAHTFQDQLYTGWMTDLHVEKLNKFETGVIDGSLTAPWKDEIWERENRTLPDVRSNAGGRPVASQSESSARAGEAAELRLADLIKGSLVRVGDVLAYKRNFPQLDVGIEKDVLIESINAHTHAITVLIQPGISQLPPSALARNPPEPSPPTLSMTISSPSQLENGVLDVDGRVEKGRRPNGNAWKCFTVWRWMEEGELENHAEDKGGRESHGTLFYLRGNYYHER